MKESGHPHLPSPVEGEEIALSIAPRQFAAVGGITQNPRKKRHSPTTLSPPDIQNY